MLNIVRRVGSAILGIGAVVSAVGMATMGIPLLIGHLLPDGFVRNFQIWAHYYGPEARYYHNPDPTFLDRLVLGELFTWGSVGVIIVGVLLIIILAALSTVIYELGEFIWSKMFNRDPENYVPFKNTRELGQCQCTECQERRKSSTEE